MAQIASFQYIHFRKKCEERKIIFSISKSAKSEFTTEIKIRWWQYEAKSLYIPPEKYRSSHLECVQRKVRWRQPVLSKAITTASPLLLPSLPELLPENPLLAFGVDECLGVTTQQRSDEAIKWEAKEKKTRDQETSLEWIETHNRV